MLKMACVENQIGGNNKLMEQLRIMLLDITAKNCASSATVHKSKAKKINQMLHNSTN